MSTSETDRLHLYEVARARWDDDAAQTLMNLLPPDADRLATKDDLAETTAVLRTEMSELRGDLRTEMSELRGDLRAEMSELRGDLRAEMADLRGDLRAEMAELGGGLRADMAKLEARTSDRFAEQTRTILLANIGMWLSVAALVIGLRFT